VKKTPFIFLLATLSLVARVNVVVSVLPQATFVKKIGGDHVRVITMVQPGQSPHSYEPKPDQMRVLSHADVYFSIGVEFEKAWLDKFKAQNKTLVILDSSKGITRIKMSMHHHHNTTEHHADAQHDPEQHGLDPHVWTTPANVKMIARNIYHGLVKVDAHHAAYYKQRYAACVSEINRVDQQIKATLKPLKKGAKFLVFHPSWGYFARAYNLTQIPVEAEGKNPKPKALISIIKEAKKEHAKAIFVQPEFSDKSAKIIAQALGIKVVKISPLNPHWSENLINMAHAIAGK